MRSGNETSTKPDADKAKLGKDKRARVHTKDSDMGAALRQVYQRAVEEDIPDDLLDLLGKLD